MDNKNYTDSGKRKSIDTYCNKHYFSSDDYKSPKLIYRVEAVAPIPLLLRASLRAWRVAKEELPRLSFGAHWSHSDSMALSQLWGDPCKRRALAWMLSSSVCWKPRCVAISLHWCAWGSSLPIRAVMSHSVSGLVSTLVEVLSSQVRWCNASFPHFLLGLLRAHVHNPSSILPAAVWASPSPQGQTRAGFGLELKYRRLTDALCNPSKMDTRIFGRTLG